MRRAVKLRIHLLELHIAIIQQSENIYGRPQLYLLTLLDRLDKLKEELGETVPYDFI